jgi:hypothetical protein
MSSTLSTAPAASPPALGLLTDIWFLILEDVCLSYIDLKRFSRVCKTFHELEKVHLSSLILSSKHC